MNEHRDEETQKVLQGQQPQFEPLQIIDFNNLQDLSAFGERLAQLLLEQECHSLRTAEERYSLLNGIAVRYCLLLAKAQQLSKIISPQSRQNSFSFSYGMQSSVTQTSVEIQRILDNKINSVGGSQGIELSTVNYHGREFVIRGIFGGWQGSFCRPIGEDDTAYNQLTGKVYLYIYEKGEVVGKLQLKNWLCEGWDRRDPELCLGGDLSFLNSGKAQQMFDGLYVRDYNISDTILGHFLHQLMIEVFQITGLNKLELSADNEADLITVANGFFPNGREDTVLSQRMLTQLQKGESLVHSRVGGPSTYKLCKNELDHPRVHFNGSVEPVSWSSIIEKNPIITKPELFAWPQFFGIALPNEVQNQQFFLHPVDLEAPVTCTELIKVGRVGIKRLTLKTKLSDILVCQTTVGALSNGSVLERCMLLAQFDVLFNSKTKSIPEIMTMALNFDTDGMFCRLLFNRILDSLINEQQKILETTCSDNQDGIFDTVMDLLNEFLAFEKKNPDSLAVKICKEEIENRFQTTQPILFKQDK